MQTKKDLSKQTVAVLLVVAIVLSIAGTWIALTNSAKITVVKGTPNSYGEVSFTVGETEPVSETAQVGFEKK